MLTDHIPTNSENKNAKVNWVHAQAHGTTRIAEKGASGPPESHNLKIKVITTIKEKYKWEKYLIALLLKLRRTEGEKNHPLHASVLILFRFTDNILKKHNASCQELFLIIIPGQE